MSTRGAYGFRINGQDKVTYNHSDSYPTGLGHNILEFVAGFPKAKLKLIAERIELVDETSKPTEKQIKECEAFANFDVSTRSSEDWYCLLRETQGNLKVYAGDNPLKYMIDSQNFLKDSLFCEWAYIINIDEGVVEIYKGFNDKVGGKGRYASCTSETEDYYGVTLIRTVPFADVAKIPDIGKFCEDFEASVGQEDAMDEDEQD